MMMSYTCLTSSVWFSRPLRPLHRFVLISAIAPAALLAQTVRAEDGAAEQSRAAAAVPAQPVEAPQRPGDAVAEGAGAGDRLTLSAAVDRLERANLTLAAQWLEVVQARDDVIAAGQRPNTVLLIQANGAQMRLRPWEFAPKLWMRGLTAGLAARVTEAQYRNAVRTRTAELYTAFVDLQEAQMQVRLARASVTGYESLLDVTKLLTETGQLGKAELAQVNAGKTRATIGVAEAELALQQARFTLADLLSIPAPQAGQLEVADDTERPESPLHPLDELIRVALACRPDLSAYRLGLRRAQADWIRALVEQWPDLYCVAQPNQLPRAKAAGVAGALPWASSLLVSLPDLDHHRGRIARAVHNVEQTRIELAQVERRVILEVRQAQLEYSHSLSVERRLREELLPSARAARDRAYNLFHNGETDSQNYLRAQTDYNEVTQDYLKAAIRHRRAALGLNTAVGKGVLAEPR
jgi:outer membrane protein, heavy metal efflux system